MMSRELKFFDKEYYDDYRTMMESKGYHFFSILLLPNVADSLSNITNSEVVGFVFDFSSLAGHINAQTVAESMFGINLSIPTIYIADRQYEDRLKYDLRYCFKQFSYIKSPRASSLKPTIAKHKCITDLSDQQTSTFIENFRNSLYGHDKFKDDFERLIRNFRVFNKLGEHKVLSLFLLGESGVGKTEVARAIHKSLGGKKKLAKINFGNYSSETSLSSLIGSARGYIGSEDGEIFIRVRNSDVGVILIDEFEKSNAALFNYFLDVLESGKMVSSQAEEIDINGFIIIFTSNIPKEQFASAISPELRSRFDYKCHFTYLKEKDKRKYVEQRVSDIISKYNNIYESRLPKGTHARICSKIQVERYKNMRDLNKRIKNVFVQEVEAYHPKQIGDIISEILIS